MDRHFLSDKIASSIRPKYFSARALLYKLFKKLGFIFPYEEVNMTVHRLEHFFTKDIEFKAQSKWQVFDNPFQDTMISNNDVVNLSFGYTYVY
jgi:hypothetical protein